MILDTSQRSLRFKMGEVHTTNEIDISVSYTDNFQERIYNKTQLSKSLGTTGVTILAAPEDNMARTVEEIAICNSDSITHTVFVYVHDAVASPLDFAQVAVTLLAGKTLGFNRNHGWLTVV